MNDIELVELAIRRQASRMANAGGGFDLARAKAREWFVELADEIAELNKEHRTRE